MLRTNWVNVVVSVEGQKVKLTLDGLSVILEPVEALQVSDSLRTMANRAITPDDGRAKKVGKESR